MYQEIFQRRSCCSVLSMGIMGNSSTTPEFFTYTLCDDPQTSPNNVYFIESWCTTDDAFCSIHEILQTIWMSKRPTTQSNVLANAFDKVMALRRTFSGDIQISVVRVSNEIKISISPYPDPNPTDHITIPIHAEDLT